LSINTLAFAAGTSKKDLAVLLQFDECDVIMLVSLLAKQLYPVLCAQPYFCCGI